MRKYHAIIVDDQQPSIDHLLTLSKDIEYVDIIATFQNPLKAMSFLRKNMVDFIILDVELGKLNAFEFLSSLTNPRIPTILYTAYQRYEDRGYELSLVDVILKPVTLSRFKGALRRINKELEHTLPKDTSLDELYDYINVKGPGKFERQLVWFKNILYIESINKKVKIYQIGCDDPLTSNTPLRQLAETFPQQWFVQCHKSYIFNVSFFKRYYNGIVHLTVDKIRIPVGSRMTYSRFDKFLEDENKLF